MGLCAEYTACGADLTLSTTRTAKTPYRHPCRCSKLWSSDVVCHRCACVPCAKRRADFHRSIRRGGLLGEARRERAATLRKTKAKRLQEKKA